MQLQEALEKIKKINWQYLVNRAESPLMSSITDNGYPHFHESTGISWRATKIIRLGNGELLHSREELDLLRSHFEKFGINSFFSFKQQLIYWINQFLETSIKIEQISTMDLSTPELLALLNEFINIALRAHNFLLPVPIADKALTNLILQKFPNASASEKQEWLAVLTCPEKENSPLAEEKSFYNLLLNYNQPNFAEMLQKHLNEFAWIGARWYWWDKAWTKEDILERIEHAQKQGVNPREKLDSFKILQEQHSKTARELQQQLFLNSELQQLINIAKEFAFLRTWRTDIIYRAGYNARNLFYEIARRANLQEKDIVYLSYKEVLKLAETQRNPISLAELSDRKNAATKIMLDGDYTISSGKSAELKFISIIYPMKVKENELTGNIAYPGLVQGTARLLFKAEDIKKVNSG